MSETPNAGHSTSSSGTVSVTPPSAPSSGESGSEGTYVQHDAPTHLFSADALPVVPGYAVSREIARGGMGVVYAAHDPVLDREVAVKVMHHGQDAKRFVVESKVTAQLPHPGVPPVYALGTLSDGRPFLAMKLIQGRTLADELKATYLSRMLGIFERLCETVGFAHARNIVHRDLKPANVMVGAFGEVLVMDWGLAKSGIRGQEAEPSENGCFAAAREGVFETIAGQVKGTPAYMAPEQARGESVDARADVFALGGILAVMLTGDPPFGGSTVMDTVQKAAQGELRECFAYLDRCGDDAELIVIAKRCLAADPGSRYADGQEVASAVAAYRTGVEERLRQAERDRAVSEAESREQWKRRKVQLALAASVLVLVVGVGAIAWWQDRQATNRSATESRLAAERDAERRFKGEQAHQGVRSGLALAVDLRKQYKFRQADALLAQALELAGDELELRAAVEQARADLAFVVQLDDIRFRKWIWIATPGAQGNFNTKIAPPEYRKAFADHGLDLSVLELSTAAERIAASAVKPDLMAALDDWALYEPDEELRNRLLEVARRADPGPWLDRLRDPAVRSDKGALEKLAAEADLTRVSSAALSALATLMERHYLDLAPLLSAARAKHPTDFELAFALGQRHANSEDGQQIGPYDAARALRPENQTAWNNLGVALARRGDLDGAIAVYQEAIRLDPKHATAHNNLGSALQAKRDFEGAVAAYQEAIRLDPKHATAHNNLGSALQVKRDFEGAVAAFREALRLNPKDTTTHNNLGLVLQATGDLDGAIAAFREAVRLNLEDATARNNLGTALQATGDLDGAIAAFREAVRLNLEDATARNRLSTGLAHNRLGAALLAKGEFDGAIAAYKEALKFGSNDFAYQLAIDSAIELKADQEAKVAPPREVKP